MEETIMKKILLVLAIVFTMCFGVKAQHGNTDAFFNNRGSDNRTGEENASIMGLPSDHGLTGDAPAPLGSGLLILSALGGGYLIAKKKKK